MGYSRIKDNRARENLTSAPQPLFQMAHSASVEETAQHLINSRKTNRIIKSQIAVHDRTQLEAVFDYPLVSTEKFTGQKLRYEVEAFLFFPRQMGITGQSYPKERFYTDLRPLIRLREPRLSSAQLLGEAETGDRTPIGVIEAYFAAIKRGIETKNDVADEREIIDEVRIFSCSFASYYLRRIDRCAKRFKKISKTSAIGGHPVPVADGEACEDVEEAIEKTTELLRKTYSILKRWRGILTNSRHDPQLRRQCNAVLVEMAFVDEYCSYRFRDGIARLVKLCDSQAMVKLDKGFDKDAQADMKSLRRRLRAYARLEAYYAKIVEFPWIDSTSDKNQIERYVYRRGVLKRRLWKVLYLNVRMQPLFNFQQQLGAMIAAGVAAVWAVIAELFIRARAGSGPNWVASFHDSTFVVVVTSLVLAYVLKDRIKDLGRSYFKFGVLGRIPDNSERILYKTATGKIWNIGSISEYTKFLKAQAVPDEVRLLRSSVDPEGIESEDIPENVIKYQKVITVNPNVLRRLPYPIRALHDILRLNVHAFLSKLDDPQQETELLSAGGSVNDVKLPKVYHLDMVLRYSKIGTAISRSQATYDHIRLVINKKGLDRVERIG